jgi:hypothetical protein
MIGNRTSPLRSHAFCSTVPIAMSILDFFASKPEVPLPASDPPVDREVELLAELEQAQTAIDECGARMNDFRKRHCAVIGGVPMIGGETAAEAVEAKQTWSALLRELTVLQSKRSAILKAWSDFQNPR